MSKSRRLKKSKAPVTDVQSGRGYDVRNRDNYGNLMSKREENEGSEVLVPKGNRNLRLKRKRGGKYGPKRYSGRGVSD